MSKKNEKPIDPEAGEPLDDEWDGASYANRSIALKNKLKKQEAAEREAINATENIKSSQTPPLISRNSAQ